MKKEILLITTLIFNTSVFAQEYVSSISKSIVKSSNIQVKNELNNEDNVESLPEEPQVFSSCNEIIQSNPNAMSGLYTINNGIKDYEVYCEMNAFSGGWTLITAQFENNPIRWDQGIQSSYNPTLTNSTSFSFVESEIPNHSQLAVGSSLNINTNFYVDFVYTPTNIPLQTLNGSDGNSYQIHRDTSAFYGAHDPEDTYQTSSTYWEWRNTFTLDIVNGKHTFAFSPNNRTQVKRGYSYAGVYQGGNSNSYAWTIWVR